MDQEFIALSIVGLAMAYVALRFLKSTVAPPLSRLLLRSGKAKAAFWIRKHSYTPTAGCPGCKSC